VASTAGPKQSRRPTENDPTPRRPRTMGRTIGRADPTFSSRERTDVSRVLDQWPCGRPLRCRISIFIWGRPRADWFFRTMAERPFADVDPACLFSFFSHPTEEQSLYLLKNPPRGAADRQGSRSPRSPLDQPDHVHKRFFRHGARGHGSAPTRKGEFRPGSKPPRLAGEREDGRHAPSEPGVRLAACGVSSIFRGARSRGSSRSPAQEERRPVSA